ncbi:unnamed protein product [Urochloa humidicola]
MPRRSPPLRLQHGAMPSANCPPELAKHPVACRQALSTTRRPPPPLLRWPPLLVIQASSGVTTLGAPAGERPCCSGATQPWPLEDEESSYGSGTPASASQWLRGEVRGC